MAKRGGGRGNKRGRGREGGRERERDLKRYSSEDESSSWVTVNPNVSLTLLPYA